MLKINATIAIPEGEIEMRAVRARGAGGQHVNKVATAVHLRFDVRASSLPPEWKERLLRHPDQRISEDGVIVIKAQRFRSRNRNREDALARLRVLIRAAVTPPKRRRPTRRSRASQRRRLERKARRGRIKTLRGKPRGGEE